MTAIRIDPLTTASLYLEVSVTGEVLACATGFCVHKNQDFFLITNWHVVSGRNAETNEVLDSKGRIPKQISVWHHDKDRLGIWRMIKQDLVTSSGQPMWIEHQKMVLM